MTRKEYTFDAGYQPQVRAPRGTSNIMLDVIIALIPAICVGVWQFGFKALIPVCTSVLSCVFFEWAYRKLLHKHATIGDLSAVVTGLLLAMTLPANAPFWLPIIGAFFAIVFVKQLYGGIGTNFLNPALAGRAFLFASYAMLMTRWTTPNGLKASVDAITMATPLSSMKAGVALPEYFTVADMFIGRMPGCFGEISAAALLLGGIYLICRKAGSKRFACGPLTQSYPGRRVGSGTCGGSSIRTVLSIQKNIFCLVLFGLFLSNIGWIFHPKQYITRASREALGQLEPWNLFISQSTTVSGTHWVPGRCARHAAAVILGLG